MSEPEYREPYVHQCSHLRVVLLSDLSHVGKGHPLTYTQIVKSVKDYFCGKEIVFDKSVAWYTVTVKNGLQSKGMISVLTVKGKKLHRTAEASHNGQRKEPLK